MGIKLRNDTNSDIIAIVFTYLFVPHPALVYRTTLVVHPGERIYCPTWQSMVEIVMWETTLRNRTLVHHVRQKISDKMAAINMGRLAFSVFGTEYLVSAAETVADMLLDGVMDKVIHNILEAAIDLVIGELAATVDGALAARENAALRHARAETRGTRFTWKTIRFTMDLLVEQRQFKIERDATNRLAVDDAGFS
ncbi:hypothetical protein SDRG_16640 [Saprolegnia diclina VS20]|uniref:Uncharacterized protein n=1 Tax=Saprolegnia diclina (strain VS20) TaxID=1156394 RepID=T0PJF8_SAPDV|nr:hypothetical protein SDRG_16640 [Saprolegnia diclina VS20]EQC25494.1 hypothetical protein SDRG_16640 [Saprolegnia diclina VS20]|eukprot:XP_008621078.1 hypothetical protein SDRG_16640 [Saprolegnia diclina VS20]